MILVLNKKIERDRGDEVDQEPAFEIVDRYFPGVGNHFIVLIHICCPRRVLLSLGCLFKPEVDHDINDEHNIDNELYDDDRIIEAIEIIQIHRLPGHILVIQVEIEDGDERLRTQVSRRIEALTVMMAV